MEYPTPKNAMAIPRGRPRLAAVLQRASRFIGIDDVVAALNVSRSEAGKTLARWNAQGWIKRVRRGVYVAVPLDTRTNEQVLEDPWLLIPQLFGDCYVAGWSAAEHWGLTEQIFRSICVFTTKPVKEKSLVVQGTTFQLKHVEPKRLFGLKQVWRGAAKVQVSAPAKTIVDMLDDPVVGGGIRHVAECLDVFLSENAKDGREQLVEYADALGNRAVFKRLGFLVEGRSGMESLLEACRARLSTGIAKLDPAIPAPRMVTRWRLRVPATWTREQHRD